MTYIKKLKEFKGAGGDENNLTPQFEELASYFMTQGYLLVNDTKKIYICDVEFYYHEEKEGGIKDWIVYHRDTKDSEGERKTADYFDVGQLHAHVSGIDITFENSEERYRAAMLIRGFKIDDPNPKDYEKRSTKVYDALLHYENIGTGINIRWHEEPIVGYILGEPIVRHNVAEFVKNDRDIFRAEKIEFDENIHKDEKLDKKCEKSKYKQCMRKWRYIKRPVIYLSKWLKKDFATLYDQISEALSKHGEECDLLSHTQDYWCRDYMPIPLPNGGYLRYRYYPDYLNNSKDRKHITDPSRAIDALGLKCIETDIILDGGNVIRCGDKVVMIDKIFSENPHYKRDALIEELKRLFDAKLVLLLPWDKKAEKYGHADGVVRYIGGGQVLLTNYRDYDPQMHERFAEILSKHFEVKELSYTQPNPNDSSWAYINYIQTERVIIIPKLGSHKDAEALAQFNKHFPHYKGRIEQVDASKIVKEGGALNCISWSLKI